MTAARATAYTSVRQRVHYVFLQAYGFGLRDFRRIPFGHRNDKPFLKGISPLRRPSPLSENRCRRFVRQPYGTKTVHRPLEDTHTITPYQIEYGWYGAPAAAQPGGIG